MAQSVQIGNLALECPSDDYVNLFGLFGQVARGQMARNPESGRSGGFGFVRMANDFEASAAMVGFGGHSLRGRAKTTIGASPLEGDSSVRGGRGSFGGGAGGRGGFGGGRGSGGGYGGGRYLSKPLSSAVDGV